MQHRADQTQFCIRYPDGLQGQMLCLPEFRIIVYKVVVSRVHVLRRLCRRRIQVVLLFQACPGDALLQSAGHFPVIHYLRDLQVIGILSRCKLTSMSCQAGIVVIDGYD